MYGGCNASTLVASPGGRLTKTRNCTLLSNTKQNLSTHSAKKSLKMTYCLPHHLFAETHLTSPRTGRGRIGLGTCGRGIRDKSRIVRSRPDQVPAVLGSGGPPQRMFEAAVSGVHRPQVGHSGQKGVKRHVSHAYGC